MIEAYLSSLETRGYSKSYAYHSRRVLEGYLCFIRKPLDSSTREDIRHYHCFLAERGLSPQTRLGMLSILRNYFSFAVGQGRLLGNPCVGIRIRQRRRDLPYAIPRDGCIRSLFDQVDTRNSLGIRDRAILELFYSSGIRRNELICLDVYDIDLARRQVSIRLGKGGTQRIVPLGRHACWWIRRYLTQARSVKDIREQALFTTIRGKRMKYWTINEMVAKYAQRLGSQARITPHLLRHSCAVGMLTHGADIRLIQELLGHKHLTTTQRYTSVSIADVQDMHTRYHPRSKLHKKNSSCLEKASLLQ